MNVNLNFDTGTVRERDRFAYWREAVCDSYVQLGCEKPKEQEPGFSGRISLSRLSNLSLSFVSGKSHDVHRRRRDISRSADSFFLLSLQLKQSSNISQGNRSAVLMPGDCAIYSSTERYMLRLTDEFEQLVVQMPKQQLLARVPNADLLTACRIPGTTEIGKVVGASILGFARSTYDCEFVQSRVEETLIDLVATGLSSIKEFNFELSLPEQHIYLRARTYIYSHLSDPDLDRTAVAKAVGISVRRLGEIFLHNGYSVSAYIRSARLDRIAKELTDPKYNALSISEIAMKWGYNNFQHFSKSFSAAYGVPPREYRRQSRDQS
jgi:AraC-like DNA-binding protein